MQYLEIMQFPYFRTVFRYATATTLALLVANVAFADAMCGNEERAYLDVLIKGLQPHARLVTPRGRFSATAEYGDGTMAVRLSFSENGKPLFTFRSADAGPQWAGIGARPGSTKSGQPSLTFYFNQGNTGACEANVLVKEGRFVYTPLRYVR